MSETILALRVKDFCLRIGISASTFWKYNKHGKIRIIRVGGRVLIPHGEALRIATEGLTEIHRQRSRENETAGAGSGKGRIAILSLSGNTVANCDARAPRNLNPECSRQRVNATGAVGR